MLHKMHGVDVILSLHSMNNSYQEANSDLYLSRNHAFQQNDAERLGVWQRIREGVDVLHRPGRLHLSDLI
jgi:hypothetical protein